MPQATEAQKAIWRVDRALMNGKEPKAEDIALLPEGVLEELQEKATKRAEAQEAPRRQFQAPQLDQPSQPNLVTPSQPKSEGTTGQERSQDTKRDKGPDRREFNREERDWYGFFDKNLGPLVVLIIYAVSADLEKAAFYAPSPQECHDFAPHGAKLMPKFENLLEKLFGKLAVAAGHTAIMSSNDVLPAIMIVIGYMHRIGALDAIMPWLSTRANKVRENAEPAGYSEGLRAQGAGEEYSRPAIDPRDQYSTNGHIDPRTIPGLGAQWAADI